MYVLQRHGDGVFVAKSGQAASYTNNILNAQTFPDKTAAERNKCGNESAVPLSSFFPGSAI